MIGPLRRRHAWLAPGAFLVAAVGLAIGVAARPTEFMEGARERPREVPSAFESKLVEIPGSPRMSVAAYHRDSVPEQSMTVWLVAHERIEAPDVLAYFTRSEVAGDGALPADAALLGSVSPLGGTRLVAPAAIADAYRIVLYSLGQQRVVRTIGMGALMVENR